MSHSRHFSVDGVTLTFSPLRGQDGPRGPCVVYPKGPNGQGREGPNDVYAKGPNGLCKGNPDDVYPRGPIGQCNGAPNDRCLGGPKVSFRARRGQDESHTAQEKVPKRSLLLYLSRIIVGYVERSCGLWGLHVARHPLLAVVGSLLLVTFLGCGLVRLNLVFRPYDLWVPKWSEFSEVTNWKLKNFPGLYREQIAILEADNILSADNIREMFRLHHQVQEFKVHYMHRTIRWHDVCVQIPIDSTYDQDTFSCYEKSLLEIWGYNASLFNSLTDSGVVEDLNSVTVSHVYQTPLNVSVYLGGTIRDEDGKIISAKTAIYTWITKINKGEINRGEYEVDVGTGETVDISGMEWEKGLVALAENWKGNISINIRAGHTLGYVLHNSISRDAIWIGVGWTVLLIYVLLTLGKPMEEDQRMIPACVGLLAIGMAVLSSYGGCSMIGIPFGTLNNVLPVLLVALGVDDMYVIVTAWDGFKHVRDLDRRAQLAMKKAGMAITVTSVTDILAFLVGTTTSLPGLQWFCIYSAVGITMVFFLQGTLFVAAVVVNQRWTDSKKARIRKENSYVVAIHKWKLKLSIRACMDLWGRCLRNHSTKAVVFVVTALMLVFSTVNISFLGREFDTIWLIPESSNLYKWYHTVENTFPQKSEVGVVFFKGAKFPDDLSELKMLSKNLSSLPEILDVEAWFDDIDLEALFERYSWLRRASPRKQCKMLLQYLGIAKQRHFRIDFNLEEEEEEEEEKEEEEEEEEGEEEKGEKLQDHPCSTFQIEFQYLPPKTFSMKQASMAKIRRLVEGARIEGFKAAWAHLYSQWETDRIIIEDLVKSLCIVLSVVGLISLILLASLRASAFVLLCVVATLANVASCVYLWDLTINTVTGIAFVLAIGICVDYAAHIAHDFLSAMGTKQVRVGTALRHMGAAVFHGGSSTCLTFLLLSPSDNYIFISYFKILSCVSFFGLFHALVFLPALLILFGPDPHPLTFLGPPKPSQSKNDDVESNPPIGSESIYAIKLPSTLTVTRRCCDYYPHVNNPPPYLLSHTVCPPLYRKSSSLPSLAVFLSEEEGMGHHRPPSNSSSETSSDSSSQRSCRLSNFCTRL